MPEEKHTQFAQRAIGFAELFNMLVGAETLGGGWSVELSAPDGPSTAGGKQSVQHIKLVPVGGGHTTVAGSASTVDRRAELRSWDHLDALHRARFRGARLTIERARYDELLKKIEHFFAMQGIQVVRTGPPPPVVDPRGVSTPIILLAVLIGLLVAGGVAAFFLLRR